MPNIADYQYPMPVRERIMEWFKAAFEEVTDLAGETGLSWESVVRAPLTDAERKFKTCLSIMEGRERENLQSIVTNCLLDVTFEFEIRSYVGEQPASFQNYVLSALKKTLAENRQAGGLCLHVLVTGSETDIQTDRDKSVGGIVFATISYRHVDGDPSRLLGE